LTDSQSRAETETVSTILTREPSKQTYGIEDAGSQSKRHLEGIESSPNFIESHKEYSIAPKVKQIDKTNAKTKPEKMKYFIFHRVLLKVREAKFIKLPKEMEQLNENGKRKDNENSLSMAVELAANFQINDKSYDSFFHGLLRIRCQN
jgi:hypothetical protein